MPSISSLLPKLTTDYPSISFQQSDRFHWSPQDQTVYYAHQSDEAALLLHELSHGLLKHVQYERDIELISLERQAWDKASLVASNYGFVIDEEVVQSYLDTYRQWLHERSLCPNCQATGHQIKKQSYRCIVCYTQWHVNEARLCGLKRHIIQKHPI